MRPLIVLPALLCLAMNGCKTPAAPAAGGAAAPQDYGGWQRVQSVNRERRVVCGELPVLVEVSHAGLGLIGSCGYVRVAGDHLDLSVDLSPGGTIEVTGGHNDITWRQPRGPRPPTLINAGTSNSFHAGR